MAAIIDELKLYGNVNYTIGAREVPPPGSQQLPAQKYTFQNVKCNKTLFTLDIPAPYLDCIDLTYLRAAVTIRNTRQVIYGWITGISQIAGVGDAVRIDWEIDYWRTYAAFIRIRRGHVLRCPGSLDYDGWHVGTGTAVCPPVYQRVISVDKKSDHTSPEASLTFDPLRHNWALFCYTSSGNVSGINWGCFPIDSQIATPTDGVSQPWRLRYLYDGTVDEKLGLDPKTISGFWVIPFCPVGLMTMIGLSETDILYKCDGIRASDQVIGSGTGLNTYVFAKIIDPEYLGVYGNVGYDLRWVGTTDDTSTIVVCNQVGSVAWSLPYYPPSLISSINQTQLHVDFAVQASAVDCQILVLFSAYNPQTGEYYYRDSEQIQLGMCCQIPAVSVPISSNAWSEYVYSGARDFDIESQKAQNEAAMYRGMLGAGNSAMFGAFAGAAVGNPVAGGIIGGIGQIIGSAIGGNVDEGLRQEIQELKDHYVSRQSNGLLLPGSSSSWVWASFTEGIRILHLNSENPDWYTDQSKNGFRCDVIVSPVNISTWYGPWQIADAVIIGDNVPTAARLQIAKMLASGIYVTERNG